MNFACDRAAPLASCTDDLRGVYVVDPGTATEAPGDERRWMLLDHRVTLEAYPLFDDRDRAVPGLEIAPRVLDLRREGESLAGEMRRRYLRGADRCEARTAVRITSCRGTTLELVLADPVAPTGFQPCTWGTPATSRRERWSRIANTAVD
ncbi:MAG: hypothetical protein H0T89_25705 [Deltaproteobacteria bacterium]|nr:hypothetical protein [Deltaproteobacteria bacterium]MDQ3295915.1 hypothetical protein [Myxococcota bacterium]